jgi:hypothetical protein
MTERDDESTLSKPFGEESRRSFLNAYFGTAGPVTPENAWKHVYRLLLWVNPTIGLAHCYESDKCQPGRPWYARSLSFHSWISKNLGTTPMGLAGEVDWLFKRCTEGYARAFVSLQKTRVARVEEQRRVFANQEFPAPGEDPELEAIISRQIAAWYGRTPPAADIRLLAEEIRAYLTQENKRKNLVGEGFEDVIAALIRRAPRGSDLTTKTRALIHELPGFRNAAKREKQRAVDVSILGPLQRRRLISAKWSVRADREEQFRADYGTYSTSEVSGEPFEFILITNEFDAARLERACTLRPSNANTFVFSQVVHVNPQGPLEVYGKEIKSAAAKLPEHIASGRLISLEQWLAAL